MPAVQLRSVPPKRSPEREALAKAIEQHEAAQRELAANELAQSASQQAVAEARHALEEATEAIEEAKLNAARHLTNMAMGAVGDTPVSIRDARASAQDAQDALESAVMASEQLKKDRPALISQFDWAADKLEKSIRMVLRTETAVAIVNLLNQAKAVQADLGAKRILLSHLKNECFDWTEQEDQRPITEFLSGVAYPWEWSGKRNQHPILEPWRHAHTELSKNADAALPI